MTDDWPDRCTLTSCLWKKKGISPSQYHIYTVSIPLPWHGMFPMISCGSENGKQTESGLCVYFITTVLICIVGVICMYVYATGYGWKPNKGTYIQVYKLTYCTYYVPSQTQSWWIVAFVLCNPSTGQHCRTYRTSSCQKLWILYDDVVKWRIIVYTRTRFPMMTTNVSLYWPIVLTHKPTFS